MASDTSSLTGWASQLLRRQLPPRPRTSPDQIPASRETWAIENLPHLMQDLPEMAEVHRDLLLWKRESHDVTADVYVPKGEGPFPVLVYIHGGSWVLWTAQHMEKLCRQIAETGVVVVNVDYGLAPEHPWPSAVEDSLYATRWAAKHAAEYSGDASRLFISGDSAGGNLSATTIIAAGGAAGDIDQGDLADVPVQFAGAVLLYGIFDHPLLFAEPGTNSGTGFIETTWNLAYLGPNFIAVHRNPLVSPSYFDALESFPPSYLSCGAVDALLPQTLRFGKQLIEAGVPTTISVVEGGDHAFLMLPEFVPGAVEELDRIARWIHAH